MLPTSPKQKQPSFFDGDSHDFLVIFLTELMEAV
jgi:hypothetical protein